LSKWSALPDAVHLTVNETAEGVAGAPLWRIAFSKSWKSGMCMFRPRNVAEPAARSTSMSPGSTTVVQNSPLSRTPGLKSVICDPEPGS
jgi:hypothetical protein